MISAAITIPPTLPWQSVGNEHITIYQQSITDHVLKALLPVSGQLSLPKSTLHRSVPFVLKTLQKLNLQSASIWCVIYKDQLPSMAWWRYFARQLPWR